MNQIKKFAVPLSISGAVLLVILIWALFFKQTNIYNAIPASAIAVIEAKDWQQVLGKLHESTSGTELGKSAAATKLIDEMTLLQSILNDKTQSKKINLGEAVVSLHLTSAEDFDYLFTVHGSIDETALLNQLNANKSIRQVQVRNFRNQQVYDVAIKGGQQVTFSVKSGIIIFSFTAFLTESSITSLVSGEQLSNNKAFKAVHKRVPDTGAFKLFFNFKGAGTMLPLVVKREEIPMLNDVTSFADWAGYSISLNNDEMRLTGVASALAPNPKGVKQNVLSSPLLASIPDNAAYVRLTTHNFEKKKNATDKTEIKDWFGNTSAFITLEPLQEQFSDQNIFMLEVKNEADAAADLKSKTSAVDVFNTEQIYAFDRSPWLSSIFESSFTSMQHSFFVLRKGAVIFCNNKDVLKFALEKIAKGETLDKDVKFKDAAGHVNVSSVVYVNPKRAHFVFQNLIKSGSAVGEYLSQFNSIISESDMEGDLTGNTIILKTGGAPAQASGLLWKTKLQFPSDFAPQIVLNNKTREQEIFTQDTAGNIYLISKSGEILFTKSIEEKIISSIYTLDYYNNDKQQFLFNSASHVYMVDRKGNFVASYPLRLSGAATAGLTMVHEGTSGNRYFVPCNNGNVYGYESNGRPLPGWSPKNGVGILSHSLLAYSNGKSSLLIAFNNAGRLMAFDAKGTLKWSVDNLPLAKQNFSLVNQSSGFVLLNAAGNQLTEISADGNDNIKRLIDSAGSFTATGIDSSVLYFFSTPTSVRAYKSGEFKTAISLTGGNISALDVIELADGKYLQVTGGALNKVLIYHIATLTKGEKASEGDGDAELAIESPGLFKITNLFGSNDLTGLVEGPDGSISCYRIK